MRIKNLNTKIFLDSADPEDTKVVLTRLGFLDGQTTNPTLVGRSSQVSEAFTGGVRFTREEVLELYRRNIEKISEQIPEGSVSIEVEAGLDSRASDLVEQARWMNTWIPNAHIKLPVTEAGIEAAEILVKEGVRVNMTLVFTLKQAQAVHLATRGARKGMVYLSPFKGRLDDRGEDGVGCIRDILRWYKQTGSHVEVLGASIRDLSSFLDVLSVGTNMVTAPKNVLEDWYREGLPLPNPVKTDISDTNEKVAQLSFENWRDIDISHELTDAGLKKFQEDWEKLFRD